MNPVIDGKIVLDDDYWVCAVALDVEGLEGMEARFLRDALREDLAAGKRDHFVCERVPSLRKSGLAR